jgi:hypothetical protein
LLHLARQRFVDSVYGNCHYTIEGGLRSDPGTMTNSKTMIITRPISR